METHPLKIVDVFAEQLFQGNPACVILSEKHFPAEICQKIAREINLPATCFVNRVNDDFHVRFFTPLSEIEQCGHGAIATVHALMEIGLVTVNKPTTRLKLTTPNKTLNMEIIFESDTSKIVWIDLGKPFFWKVKFNETKIQNVLGIDSDQLANLPIEKVSLGTTKVIVPLRTLKVLNEINPESKSVLDFCREENVTGIHAFTLETSEKRATAHARHYSLAEGGIEDAVSGLANGALGCYLLKNGLIKCNGGAASAIFKQGKLDGRTGYVFVNITVVNGTITKVRVGGKAVTSMKGKIIV